MVLAFVSGASYFVMTVHYEIVSHLAHRVQLWVTCFVYGNRISVNCIWICRNKDVLWSFSFSNAKIHLEGPFEVIWEKFLSVFLHSNFLAVKWLDFADFKLLLVKRLDFADIKLLLVKWLDFGEFHLLLVKRLDFADFKKLLVKCLDFEGFHLLLVKWVDFEDFFFHLLFVKWLDFASFHFLLVKTTRFCRY